MRPDSRRVSRVGRLAALCLLTACSSSPAPTPLTPDAPSEGTGEPSPTAPDAGPAPDAGVPGDGGPGVTRSTRNNPRFKGPERLTADFAAALSLPADQVCNELGLYPCTTSVHTVTLGGVEPYGNGFYEPLPVTGVTSPIAVDRVALAACGRRVALDVATPGTAVIFKGLTLDAAGRLREPQGPAVQEVLTTLYQRALLRDPTPTELAALVQLSTDIAGTASPQPGTDWMKAACFVVLSSAESVFY